MRNSMKLVFISLISLASTACVSAEMEEGNWVDLARSGGEGIYVEKCGMCHQADGMGTGLLGRRYEGDLALLESREDLNEEFVITVVRNGLGNMLPMARGEVSDSQLEAVAAYLAGDD